MRDVTAIIMGDPQAAYRRLPTDRERNGERDLVITKAERLAMGDVAVVSKCQVDAVVAWCGRNRFKCRVLKLKHDRYQIERVE